VGERIGTVQVYTGSGKGKTTAALGQALRALGHGWRVLVIQFMKGDPGYGEVIAAPLLANLTLVQSGLPTFVKKGEPSAEDLRLAAEGFEQARAAVVGRQYDMVILDEINVAVDYGLIPLEDVLSLIRSRPPQLELVLTGRYAHPKILEAADLVSEVVEMKHHFQKGVQAREGVEY
jgi:cob(I)alamin adenosyltransferase